MIASHQDIESVRGFMHWFADGDATSRGEPAEVVNVNGIGCTFSRSLTEGERADILGFLRAHADKHKERRLTAMLSAPLAEISGARIDEVRAACWKITRMGDFMPHMSSSVVLAFGARREAAEEKRKTLGPRIFGTEILEKDGQCFLVGKLQIPLDQSRGTVAEIQKHIEAARKEIGDVELEHPPVFMAEVSMRFDDQWTADVAVDRLSAAGLTLEIGEHVNGMGTSEVVHWQERWRMKSRPSE